MYVYRLRASTITANRVNNVFLVYRSFGSLLFVERTSNIEDDYLEKRDCTWIFRTVKDERGQGTSESEEKLFWVKLISVS